MRWTPEVWSKWWRWVGLALVVVAIFSFLERAVLRAEPHMMDFHFLCNATRTWFTGQNPYDPNQIMRQWDDSGGRDHIGGLGDPVTIYPPSSFPLIAPFALLSPIASARAWLGMQLLCLATMLALCIKANRVGYGLAAMLFIALSLAWWPVRMAVYHGQPALPAAALGVAAFMSDERGRHRMAGVLLGCAAALKPHLAAPILLLLLLHKRWTCLVCTMAVWVCLAGVGIWQLHDAGWNGWLADWCSNLNVANHAGNTSDVAFSNGVRFDMIQLQVPLYALWQSRVGANVLSLLCCLGCGAVLFWLHRKRTASDSVLLLGALCTLSLMVVYHRTPDIVLILPAAAVAFRPSLRPAARVIAAVTLLPMVIAADTLSEAATRFLPLSIYHHVTDPFRALSVVLAFLGMLAVMWQSRRNEEVLETEGEHGRDGIQRTNASDPTVYGAGLTRGDCRGQHANATADPIGL